MKAQLLLDGYAWDDVNKAGQRALEVRRPGAAFYLDGI